MPTMFRSSFLTAGGLRLHYVACGRPDAPLLLFLHGFPEHCLMWRKVMSAFSADWHAVALDLPGYYLSDKPTDIGAYRVGAVAGTLQAFVKALGFDHCVVVGHDWGGAIGWYLAATQSSLLDGFVAINAVHPTVFALEFSSNPLQRQASEYIEQFRRPGAEDMLAGKNFGYLFGMFVTDAGRPLWMDSDVEAEYLHAWAQPGALSGGLAYYRASSAVNRESSDRVPAPSAQRAMIVNVPTLVIWGENDKFLLKGNLEGLQQYVPQLRIERLPKSSHWVVHEQPVRVTQLIHEFAGSLRAGQGQKATGHANVRR